jgi:hypothetical protein
MAESREPPSTPLFADPTILGMPDRLLTELWWHLQLDTFIARYRQQLDGKTDQEIDAVFRDLVRSGDVDKISFAGEDKILKLIANGLHTRAAEMIRQLGPQRHVEAQVLDEAKTGRRRQAQRSQKGVAAKAADDPDILLRQLILEIVRGKPGVKEPDVFTALGQRAGQGIILKVLNRTVTYQDDKKRPHTKGHEAIKQLLKRARRQVRSGN